jgi:sigma-70-like protein
MIDCENMDLHRQKPGVLSPEIRERYLMIIRLREVERLTFGQIGVRLDVTSVRARQLYRLALAAFAAGRFK